MSTVPLILSEGPVTKETVAKPVPPYVGVIYVDGTGQCADLGGRGPSQWEIRRKRYRSRYEVDLSDHHRTVQLDQSPLPAQGGATFFDCTVDVSFRVSDPVAVVRRHVTDALQIIYSHLITAFYPVARRYAITDAQGAEDALNRLFSRPEVLEQGMTIFRCKVRLLPDQNTQKHAVDAAEVRHQQNLRDIEQRARLEAENREREALSRLSVDVQSLVLDHLAKHPDQTESVLQLLSGREEAAAARQDVKDQRSREFLLGLVDRGMIRSPDIEDRIRRGALDGDSRLPLPAKALALDPTEWVAEPLETGLQVTESADPRPTAAPAEVSSVLPIYLIVDESPGGDDYLKSLSRAIQSLPLEVAPEINDGQAATTVRVAVIGYASDAAVRMPLTAVNGPGFAPRLVQRPGSRLGQALDLLRERITEDASRLKWDGLVVGRPVAYLLCATAPEDAADWRSACQRLTDRSVFPAAPNILACGIGSCPGAVIAALTAAPQSAGWRAPAEMPLAEAARRYLAFVGQSVPALVGAHIGDRAQAKYRPPSGFLAVGRDD
jgi:uncharacterized protein YegL